MVDPHREIPPALRLIPPASARTLARVAGSGLPVLCLDCFGAAFSRIAASIHAASRRDRLITLDLHATRDDLLAALIRAATSPRCTLAIDGIEKLGDDAQAALLRLMDGDGPRLVSASAADLATLRATLRPDFFALVSTISVRAPALARAGEDVAAIARERLVVLAAELGCEVPAISPDAERALAAHPWPGDAAELDAVLARSLLALDGVTIRADDLRWDPLEPTAAAGIAAAPSGVHAAPLPPARSRVSEPAATGAVGSEAIAVELAHQIKNPLVTVRTFVQSVAQLASDPADLARFRDLTEEAIGRMDGALEEILAFSRLAPPRPRRIDVSALLRESLREATAGRSAKDCGVELPEDAGFIAFADEARLRAALTAISRHVLETIEPGGTLEVEAVGDTLFLRHREAGATTHLRGVSGLDDELPLALLLARGALAADNVTLESDHEGAQRCIALRFPGAEATRRTVADAPLPQEGAAHGLRRDS
jgi:signal transduction histidine kinase